MTGPVFGEQANDTLIEVDGVVRGEVAQPSPLQPTPDRFDGVQRRGIRRQLLQDQSISQAVLNLADRVPLMQAPPVPHDDHAPGQFFDPRFEEGRRGPVVEGAVDQGPEVHPHAIAMRRQPQGGRHRDLLPMAGSLGQLRCLSARSPSPTDQRGHQQAALVNPGEVGPLTPSFFWRRGQSEASHSWISAGSRFRGTRWGFCGVRPRHRSQALRSRGLKATPHSCSINWPSRAAVQSSVAKPCSVGSSTSPRKTIFAWVVVSFRGRPEAACPKRPADPWARKAAIHRDTVVRWTPRKSATSSIGYPSQTRWTARSRLRSNSAGDPGDLMRPSVAPPRLVWHYFSDRQ